VADPLPRIEHPALVLCLLSLCAFASLCLRAPTQGAIKCASCQTFVNPSSGHESRATSDELVARSFAQGSAKNSNIFEYFQTFHTIFRTFRTTFRIFSNVFKRFRSFLSETCISFAKILMCFCLIGRRVRKTPAFDRVGLQV